MKHNLIKATLPVWLLIICVFFSIFGCTQSEEKKERLQVKQKKKETNATTFVEFSPEPAVIYRTIDGGENWEHFSAGIPQEATVSCFANGEGRVYVATDEHGIFMLEAGQSKWNPISDGLPNKIDINAIISIGNRLVIGTFSQGVFVSDMAKVSWKPVENNIGKTPIRAFIQDDSRLLAGTDDGVFLSDDFGNSWKQILEMIQITGFTSLDGNIYAGTHNGAIMSADYGQTWKYIYNQDALHDISNDGEYVYAMSLGQGLKKSNNNGFTWQDANNGMGTRNLYTFELKNIGNQLFTAQWYGIYHSTDKGEHWKMLKGGLPDSTAFSTMELTDFGLLAGIAIRK